MSGDYRKKSIKEKEYANRQHGLPNRCHECDLAVAPEDIAKHRAKHCEGRPEPHPNARWLSHKQAVAMGIPKTELSELAAADLIRTKGDPGHKRYLLRDIGRFLQSKDSKAKVAEAKREAKAKHKTRAKTLTGKGKAATSKHMEQNLENRIGKYVESVGGFAPAARALDIPVDAIKRAAKGEKIRKGTRVLIEGSLDKAGA